MPRPTAASRVMPSDWSTRPISSMAMHRLVKSPAPPYSSGPPRPNRPRSPISLIASSGSSCAAFQRSTCGARSRAAKSATTARKSSCSALSRKELAMPSAYYSAYVKVSLRMSAVSNRTWTISELAAEFGTTLRTIRFYEDQGLLVPERAGTARIFHDRDRVRLQLILRGKRLGFTLAEIAHVIGLYDEPPGERGQLRVLIAVALLDGGLVLVPVGELRVVLGQDAHQALVEQSEHVTDVGSVLQRRPDVRLGPGDDGRAGAQDLHP